MQKVACTIRKTKTKIVIFSKSPFLHQASSSSCNSPQVSSIVHFIATALFASAFLLLLSLEKLWLIPFTFCLLFSHLLLASLYIYKHFFLIVPAKKVSLRPEVNSILAIASYSWSVARNSPPRLLFLLRNAY